MKNVILLLSVITLISSSCQQKQSAISLTTANGGMVSAAHPLATDAGRLMLEKGGNAADAAIAAAFALSVVEPSMSGLGGRQQVIIRAADGSVHGIDATTQAPAAYDTSKIDAQVRDGYPVIGIPGVVAGLAKLHQKFGSLPWNTLIEPAIQYAEEGFTMLKLQALRHEAALDVMSKYEGTSQYFLEPDSTAYDEGDLLIQKDLAQTLKLIAEGGKDAFYKGEIAQKIVADFATHGGLLTLDDLAQYDAPDAKIVTGIYRSDYELYGLWMPSFGAITIAILQALDRLPLSTFNETDWAKAHNLAIELAYEHRKRQLEGDSIADVLTSDIFADSLAQAIQAQMNGIESIGYQELEDIPLSWSEPIGHTTHLTTADQNGMMVALTQSLGPNMGSKVASSGLGFVYAVTNGPYLGVYKAGQRASSHISPFLITHNGKPFLALGAAGGSRIISAVTSVTSRIIDQNLSLEQALAAPRVHPDTDTALIENHSGIRWDGEVISAFDEIGVPAKWVEQKARFGRVHAVYYDDSSQMWIGAADPDWEGKASGTNR